MHQYLRAIGFSKIKSLQQMDRMHKEIQRNPDRRSVVSNSISHSLVQLAKDYHDQGIGISIVGEMDMDGEFQFEYSFPYVVPGNYTYADDVLIEKLSDREGYYGVIDNINLSIIFFLQNVAATTGTLWRGALPPALPMRLSGLSLSASILLPIQKTEQDLQYEEEKRLQELTNIRRVRRGDPKTLERMMMQEMDVKDALDHRLISEDVLSIVDSSMIPFGLQGDIYDILGTILQVTPIENTYTGEHILLLDVASLYYVIRIAINREDLTGEPEVGRRFRGVTWLQGTLLLDRPF